MNAIAESSITKDAEEIKRKFHVFLDKANKENPRPADVKAISALLYANKDLRLWEAILGMGALAEHTAIEAILGTRGQGSQACWKQRLEALRSDLGYANSPALERLLIQQVTLCWLNLNAVEYKHSNVMNQSITLTVGLFWEKRLSSAQIRFTRACESLARVRRLSRANSLQVNIAAEGGQQINVASPA